MSQRTVSHPRVNVINPRYGEPSYAELSVILDWLKDAAGMCRMTEAELLGLAEEAIRAARILRKNREVLDHA